MSEPRQELKQAITLWHFINKEWQQESNPKKTWFKLARKMIKKHLTYLKDSEESWDAVQFEQLSKDLENARDEVVVWDLEIKVQLHVYIKGQEDKDGELDPQQNDIPKYYQEVLEQLMR